MPPYSSLPSGQCRIVPLYRVLENWIYLYATVSTKLIRIAVSFEDDNTNYCCYSRQGSDYEDAGFSNGNSNGNVNNLVV